MVVERIKTVNERTYVWLLQTLDGFVWRRLGNDGRTLHWSDIQLDPSTSGPEVGQQGLESTEININLHDMILKASRNATWVEHGYLHFKKLC